MPGPGNQSYQAQKEHKSILESGRRTSFCLKVDLAIAAMRFPLKWDRLPDRLEKLHFKLSGLVSRIDYRMSILGINLERRPVLLSPSGA